MKLSLAAAFTLTLSLAAGQSRMESNFKTLPETQHPANAHAAETISADLLRQPLSRKAKEILTKAQRAADAGDHARAIEFLHAAHAKYPESDGWTQSMLGVEYIRTRQFASALLSLQQAIVLLPRDGVDRSNLGLALAATGQYAKAEVQLRCAMTLDHGDPKTRELLDLVVSDVASIRGPSQPDTSPKEPCLH